MDNLKILYLNAFYVNEKQHGFTIGWSAKNDSGECTFAQIKDKYIIDSRGADDDSKEFSKQLLKLLLDNAEVRR